MNLYEVTYTLEGQKSNTVLVKAKDIPLAVKEVEKEFGSPNIVKILKREELIIG